MICWVSLLCISASEMYRKIQWCEIQVCAGITELRRQNHQHPRHAKMRRDRQTREARQEKVQKMRREVQKKRFQEVPADHTRDFSRCGVCEHSLLLEKNNGEKELSFHFFARQQQYYYYCIVRFDSTPVGIEYHTTAYYHAIHPPPNVDPRGSCHQRPKPINDVVVTRYLWIRDVTTPRFRTRIGVDACYRTWNIRDRSQGNEDDEDNEGPFSER